MISVKTEYLEHKLGTKFYEVVLLESPSANTAMLIKRWGPLSAKKGGGQTSVQTGTKIYCRNEYAHIIKLKMAASKGYDSASGLKEYGLHRIALLRNAVPFIKVIESAGRHYANLEIVKAIQKEFEWCEAEISSAALTPEPEVDRSPAWGSF